MEHENKAIDHMDIDQSTHSISGLPVSIFHIQQQYQKHWNIIFLNYWWIFALLYELNFLLSNFLHGGLLIVLLLGFLWGSLLDGGGRLLDSSLLGFRGSSLRRWLHRNRPSPLTAMASQKSS
jgi:hypothetical protein